MKFALTTLALLGLVKPASAAPYMTSKNLEAALSRDARRVGPAAAYATDKSGFMDWVDDKLEDLKDWAGSELMSVAMDMLDYFGDKIDDKHMYMNFIPRHVATLKHNSEWTHFEGRCFKDIKVRSIPLGNGQVEIQAKYSNAIEWTCAEYVVFGNANDFHAQYKFVRGTETYTWTADVEKVHVFSLRQTFTNSVKGLIKTADFLLGRDVFEFLEYFPHFTYSKRENPGAVEIAEENIHPGDAVLVTNLHGQSATIMWASGSAASHSLVFLREPETNDLYAVESWAGGVRKLTFAEYLKDDAGWYNNAVLVPLTEEARAKFDNDAAWAKFVSDYEGHDYGFNTLIFAWVDTLKGNYPCLPFDNYQTCLSWEVIEVLVGVLERAAPEMTNLVFLEAFNHRLGTQGLSMPELVRLSDIKLENGAAQIPAIPENDEWLYHTNRNGEPVMGPSRVCSALVCELLREGGALGDSDVTCTEFTPWDIYSMDIYTGPTSQLKGDYVVDLYQPYPLRLGQKAVTDRMAETCKSLIDADSYYVRNPTC